MNCYNLKKNIRTGTNLIEVKILASSTEKRKAVKLKIAPTSVRDIFIVILKIRTKKFITKVSHLYYIEHKVGIGVLH